MTGFTVCEGGPEIEQAHGEGAWVWIRRPTPVQITADGRMIACCVACGTPGHLAGLRCSGCRAVWPPLRAYLVMRLRGREN